MTTRSQEQSAGAARPGGSTRQQGCYVYGIVADPSPQVAKEVESLSAVGNPGAAVTMVRHDGIAALVSDIPVDAPLGKPEDLRAHARALDALATAGATVLPLRFGTVVADTRAVTDEVLAAAHDDFAAALQRLAGHAQFSVKARYEEDMILREVLDEQPVARQLREELAGMPEEAGYYQRVRLGEMISEAIDAKREVDRSELLRRLEPLADASAEGREPSGEEVANAAFLVAHGKQAEFEAEAEKLARAWHGRVRVRLLGPLAPYEFASAAMGGEPPQAGQAG